MQIKSFLCLLLSEMNQWGVGVIQAKVKHGYCGFLSYHSKLTTLSMFSFTKEQDVCVLQNTLLHNSP